jgi:hypothetical protein
MANISERSRICDQIEIIIGYVETVQKSVNQLADQKEISPTLRSSCNSLLLLTKVILNRVKYNIHTNTTQY